MGKNIDQIAALANELIYNDESARHYIDGAPHIKHASLRQLYYQFVFDLYNHSKKFTKKPTVLDLGAGEGSVTIPFLELGAKVVAIDISYRQLEALLMKCAKYGDKLEVRCEDISNTSLYEKETFDIVVFNSFLHHIPDYLALIGKTAKMLNPYGQFFSFQDPLRYDSLGLFDRVFSEGTYFFWRIFKGDVVNGLKRRVRRFRGLYNENSIYDNAEYHITRNGVDQDAIRRLLEGLKFKSYMFPYFSTQSSFFQRLGAALGVKNTFAIVGKKPL